jgi:hypothetical protein
MLKYLRIAATALSVTVCVLLVALWVRSYWYEDQLANYMVEIGGYRTGGYVFRSRQGNLLISTYDAMNDPGMIPPLTYPWYIESKRITGPMTHTLANKSTTNALWRFGIRRSAEATYVNVPHWFVIILSAMLLAMLGRRQLWTARFSLRTLLIAWTLVAVGLAIIVLSIQRG